MLCWAENTARMKLKQTKKKTLPIFTNGKFEVGDSLMFNNTSVGNIIINKPYPFGLIKLLIQIYLISKTKF